MTKQTGIVDCFEGDSEVVKVNRRNGEFRLCRCTGNAVEGMVVIIMTAVSLISMK